MTPALATLLALLIYLAGLRLAYPLCSSLFMLGLWSGAGSVFAIVFWPFALAGLLIVAVCWVCWAGICGARDWLR